jgi:GntR family transcriptional regulator of arabinose operon
MLKQIDNTIPLPKYYQISESIKEKITAGQFRPGEKIPVSRELSKYFRTTPVTIANAMRLLESGGHVYRVQGSGVFVSVPEPIARPKEITNGIKKIGLVMQTSGDLYQNLSEALRRELGKHDLYNIPLSSSLLDYDVNLAQKEKCLKKYIADGFDSLVISGTRHLQYKLLHKHRSAFRQINFISQCESGIDFPEANFIVFDAAKAGQMAAEYLIKSGRKKFLFITFEGLPEKERRRNGCRIECTDTVALEGMRSVFRAAGLPDSCLNVMQLQFGELLQEKSPELLNDGPLGIFALGDNRAVPVYRFAKQMGLDFEKHLSIVGLYNTSWTEVLHPSLTSISIEEAEIARITVDCIVNNKSGQRILVEPKLIVRET